VIPWIAKVAESHHATAISCVRESLEKSSHARQLAKSG
jgi:hypothetical protein